MKFEAKLSRRRMMHLASPDQSSLTYTRDTHTHAQADTHRTRAHAHALKHERKHKQTRFDWMDHKITRTRIRLQARTNHPSNIRKQGDSGPRLRSKTVASPLLPYTPRGTALAWLSKHAVKQKCLPKRPLHCLQAKSRNSPSVLSPTVRTRASGLASSRSARRRKYIGIFFFAITIVTRTRLIPAEPSSVRRNRTPQTIRHGQAWEMAVDRPLPVEKSFRGSSVRGKGSRRLYRKGQPVAASESWASAIARKKKEATRKGRLVFLKKPINQKKMSSWRLPLRAAGSADAHQTCIRRASSSARSKRSKGTEGSTRAPRARPVRPGSDLLRSAKAMGLSDEFQPNLAI
jgi:hypothetical protein